MSRPQRVNSFHGPKRHITGNQVHVPPSWRGTATATVNGHPNKAETGSKIFLSMLPMDVGIEEIEELFRITVGPLRESFLVHNSQGHSKGMAVVVFQRPGDAAIAQAKYNGRTVDGRKPLRIQVMVDAVPEPQAPPTLFDRLQLDSSDYNIDNGPVAGPSRGGPAPQSLRFSIPAQARREHHAPPRPATPYNNNNNNHIFFPPPVAVGAGTAVPPRRFRVKKGPKRLKKQWAAAASQPGPARPFNLAAGRNSKTKAELDREMEDYRAQGGHFEDQDG
ncbi:hypothetical protein C8F01DRAFT_1129131 [Mycena amicta]|nr:hypothetical protein C8F01DRAFT_1129131 [Mycena amicta]